MKRFFKILIISMASLLALNTVTSCGGLGDMIDNLDDENYGEIESGWTEQGNKLIYKISLNYILGKYTQIMTFEFSGDTCIKATTEYVWSSELLAKSFFDSLEESEKANAKLSGKTITVDITDDFKGMSKKEIKDAIDAVDDWM